MDQPISMTENRKAAKIFEKISRADRFEILILAVKVWSSLEQRGMGLLSEMEGTASQIFEK